MGLWLPLALADITELLCDLVQLHLANPDEAKVPKRSGILERWQLYLLSSSLKAMEKEQERREKAEEVKILQAQLAAMQEKYGRPKNADKVHK
jgi:hypothetical protein